MKYSCLSKCSTSQSTGFGTLRHEKKLFSSQTTVRQESSNLATNVSSYLFAPPCSWALLPVPFFTPFLFSELSLMFYSPQSTIHFTKLNIPNKTFFSSLIRSVLCNILTAFLLIYSHSTSALGNSSPKHVHHIQYKNLRDFNTIALILSMLP